MESFIASSQLLHYSIDQGLDGSFVARLVNTNESRVKQCLYDTHTKVLVLMDDAANVIDTGFPSRQFIFAMNDSESEVEAKEIRFHRHSIVVEEFGQQLVEGALENKVHKCPVAYLDNNIEVSSVDYVDVSEDTGKFIYHMGLSNGLYVDLYVRAKKQPGDMTRARAIGDGVELAGVACRLFRDERFDLAAEGFNSRMADRLGFLLCLYLYEELHIELTEDGYKIVGAAS